MGLMQERLEDIKDILVTSAGTDPNQDRFLCGMAQAYKEFLAISFED